MKFQILEYDMQSEENSELTGGQHVRGFSKLKSSIELANETQASSGKEHNSSVVRTIAGSFPHEEQCVELHMIGAENSQSSSIEELCSFPELACVSFANSMEDFNLLKPLTC